MLEQAGVKFDPKGAPADGLRLAAGRSRDTDRCGVRATF